MKLLSGRRPMWIGIQSGPGGPAFVPPPSSPNCVSSQADPQDRVHYIEPIRIAGDPAAAWAALHAWLRDAPRTQVIREQPGYLHAECTSRLLGFVDDLECLLDPDKHLIHVRSASRMGHRDFKVNRRRVEALRRALNPHARQGPEATAERQP